MLTYKGTVLTLLAALAVPAAAAPALKGKTPEEKGLEIARLNEQANTGFIGELAKTEMTLVNAHGDVIQREMRMKLRETADDGDQSISYFLRPADIKGTRMLTWTHKDRNDDQWMYLPSIKRVKRISSRSQSGAFMGSEFAFEDLGSQEPEKYTHKFLREETTGYMGTPREAWVTWRDPVDPRSGYSHQHVWMDKEWLQPLYVEYYDRKGELLKVATFTGFKQYGKLWRIGQIDMVNVQTRKRSTISWKDRKLGLKFDAEDFESDGLEDADF